MFTKQKSVLHCRMKTNDKQSSYNIELNIVTNNRMHKNYKNNIV